MRRAVPENQAIILLVVYITMIYVLMLSTSYSINNAAGSPFSPVLLMAYSVRPKYDSKAVIYTTMLSRHATILLALWD